MKKQTDDPRSVGRLRHCVDITGKSASYEEFVGYRTPLGWKRSDQIFDNLREFRAVGAVGNPTAELLHFFGAWVLFDRNHFTRNGALYVMRRVFPEGLR